MVIALVTVNVVNLMSSPDPNNQKLFAAYRTFDPLSGVSPAMPVALIGAAVFCWAMVHAKRLWMRSLKSAERLPAIRPGDLLENLRAGTEDAIEQPFFNRWRVAAAVIIFGITVGLRGNVFDSFEPAAYTRLYSVLAGIGGAVLFLTWSRFLLIWVRFAEFLRELASHPIRSALENLPRTRSWSAIFQSPALLSNAYWEDKARETWNRLNASARAAAAGEDAGTSAAATPVSLDPRDEKMKKCIDLMQTVWERGAPESWSRKKAEREKHLVINAIDRSDERIILAGEFIAQPFHRFVTYVLLHMRNLLLFISIGFALVTLSLFSFPFQSHHLLSSVAVVTLLVIGASLVYVFAQVERDTVLSWMNDTPPGELGGDFYLKVISYGAIPLATLLSTQFPSIGRTLLDWIQPVSEALK